MIKSMTGFGRSEYLDNNYNVTIEMRSVNSRFFDLRIRGFSINMETENSIRHKLEEKLIRGNITLRINVESLSKIKKESFDKEKFEMIQNILDEIHVSYGQKINLSEIVSLQDLMKPDNSTEINFNIIFMTVLKALDQLEEMRTKEGESIFNDLIERIKIIKLALSKIEKISETFSVVKERELRKKIIDLLSKDKIDESRLIQEVAYISERSDITEEIVRCKSHFDQLDFYLNKNEPVGKRIGFLIQEINREINTIGSKSPQTNVTNNVVEIKAELEKIREQISNIL